MYLKQSTAAVIPFGPFVDKTDGVTLETGLVSALDNGTTGILLSKNGGTLTIRHATVTATTYDAHGCYQVTLDTTDTATLGALRVIYTDAATCLPVWQDFEVVTANVYDSLFSTDVLDVSVTQILGTAVSSPATAGVLDVNVKNINNTAAATPGAAGGLFIAGANAATSITTALTANITGNLSGSVGSVATGGITAASIATGAIDADAFAADAIGAAELAQDAIDEIKAAMVEALNTDTYAEPGQGAPPATTTLVGKIGYLYKAWRNRSTQTATEYALYNDDATTKGQKATFSDNATTADRGEIGTGA